MDDSILFCRAKEIECQVILDLLVVYEKKDLDRKSIEIRKTFFFSSSNTHLDVQTRIQQLLGVPSIRHFEKYLELPAFAGRAKKQNFVYIKEMVWKKLQG